MSADETLREIVRSGVEGQRLSRFSAIDSDKLFEQICAQTFRNTVVEIGDENLFYRNNGIEDKVEARTLGRKIFLRWSKNLHSFVCSPSEDDENEREELISAIFKKGPGANAVIAGVLVASFGLSPGTAAIIAILLLRILVVPVVEELCLTWGEFNADFFSLPVGQEGATKAAI